MKKIKIAGVVALVVMLIFVADLHTGFFGLMVNYFRPCYTPVENSVNCYVGYDIVFMGVILLVLLVCTIYMVVNFILIKLKK